MPTNTESMCLDDHCDAAADIDNDMTKILGDFLIISRS